MARVELDLRPFPGGSHPQLRMRAMAAFGRKPEPFACIVDTGAPYPVLLAKVWQVWQVLPAVRATVTFVDPPTAPLPAFDIAGRRYSYRWGRLPVCLHDWVGGPPLPPVEVLCQLCVARLDTTRKPDLSAPVLGLGGGLFDGRHLTLTPGPAAAAWVQDVPPAP